MSVGTLALDYPDPSVERNAAVAPRCRWWRRPSTTKVGVRFSAELLTICPVTADQIHLLRKSFHLVEAQGTVAALVFYRRLFELDPALRPLFRTDIEVQAKKLMEMLGVVLSLVDRPETLDVELELSGQRHAGYGVRTEHYATVGAAILFMLEDVLGSHWTPEVKGAWSDFYGYVTERMQRGAARVRPKPPKHYAQQTRVGDK